MKKLSILLALVLLVGMLAACNPEEAPKGTTVFIPGYLIDLPVGDGWTAAEEPSYDLELSKDGIKLYAMGFSVADFVDPPMLEDLNYECEDTLFSTLTDVSVKEETSEYSAKGKRILVTMYAGKDGDTSKQFYCFAVDFGEETGTSAWICFAAKADAMKKNKDTFKSIVENAVCTAKLSDMVGLDGEDDLLFDENGELIVDVTEPEDIPYDYEETEPTVTPEAPTEDAEPAIEIPSGTEPASTEATTAATEATVAATTAP